MLLCYNCKEDKVFERQVYGTTSIPNDKYTERQVYETARIRNDTYGVTISVIYLQAAKWASFFLELVCCKRIVAVGFSFLTRKHNSKRKRDRFLVIFFFNQFPSLLYF